MKKKRKSATLFAESGGKLFVRGSAVMHPLIPMVDGLSICTFPKDKHVYLFADEALAWCKKEIREVFKPATIKDLQIKIDVLERALRDFAEEKVKFVGDQEAKP